MSHARNEELAKENERRRTMAFAQRMRVAIGLLITLMPAIALGALPLRYCKAFDHQGIEFVVAGKHAAGHAIEYKVQSGVHLHPDAPGGVEPPCLDSALVDPLIKQSLENAAPALPLALTLLPFPTIRAPARVVTSFLHAHTDPRVRERRTMVLRI